MEYYRTVMYPAVEIIRTLADNFTYLVHARAGHDIAIVDPGEAPPVISRLSSLKWTPTEVWLTHKHRDHISGAETLARRYNIPIRAPQEVPLLQARMTHVENGTHFAFGASTVRVYGLSGHTRGHVVYHCDDALFSGDTLFIGGCGRIFEGTAQELFDGFERHFYPLPDQTRVYCGHEYAEKNLRFALEIEPYNEEVINYLRALTGRKRDGSPSVPGEIGLEKAVNPFMRVKTPAFLSSLKRHHPELPRAARDVFALVRKLRDSFS